MVPSQEALSPRMHRNIGHAGFSEQLSGRTKCTLPLPGGRWKDSLFTSSLGGELWDSQVLAQRLCQALYSDFFVLTGDFLTCSFPF